MPGKANKVADVLSCSVPPEDLNSANQGHSVIALTFTGAAKLATPSYIPLTEGMGSSSLPMSPIGGTHREMSVSAKSMETAIRKILNECDEYVGWPENEEVEWNVDMLMQSQNNHPVWSKIKAHFKDASISFLLEGLLPKECFSLSNDVL